MTRRDFLRKLAAIPAAAVIAAIPAAGAIPRLRQRRKEARARRGAIELDAFSRGIPDLVAHSTTLYGIFENRSISIPAAGGVTRPSFRIPLRAQAGAATLQAAGNADAGPPA